MPKIQKEEEDQSFSMNQKFGMEHGKFPGIQKLLKSSIPNISAESKDVNTRRMQIHTITTMWWKKWCKHKSPYDFIIGSDILSAISTDILYSTGELQWEGVQILLKEHGLLMDKEASELHYLMATESSLLQQA